ncbi:RHS repeat domain-containing protein [Cellulosimicrobium sp. NPDC057127]|uniref:RHS repeat domain-containing protein n=1 Tax=Cellulosimicrobium sp. NPDC057127 TaxID=3346026 RepID=UPI00363F19EE
MKISTTRKARMSARRGGRLRAAVAASVGSALVVTLLVAPPAAGEDELAERESWTLEERAAHGQQVAPTVDQEAPIPAEESSLRARVGAASRQEAVSVGAKLPGADRARVDLGRSTAKPVEVGGLDVALSVTETRNAGDGEVLVESAGAEAAAAVGLTGTVLELEDADGGPLGEQVEVEVDFTEVGGAFGGDWASRARFVELPECALTDPDAARCQRTTELETVNTGRAATTTLAAGSSGVVALAAAPTGPTGDWTATPLAASATWQVSEQTGDFAWSYPLRVPPVGGGLEPALAISYNSGSLDGRVASTNNQSSWIGDGWDLATGFVERKYAACTDDQSGGANNATRDTGDLCWKSDNATLMLSGSATELIKDAATGTWRPKRDDGTKVEKLTGAWNSGQAGEHWKVTTPDGTQYFFGRDKRSATDTLALNSAWTVPVYGNHPGEPCYEAAFADSSCNQVWRWNLDYVIDTSGNSLTYVYAKETNSYGRNLGQAVSSYVRGGHLSRIEYGTRAGAEAGVTAPGRVDLTVAERCVQTSTFACAPGDLTTANAAKWPDVPFDLICTSATSCPGKFSPSFFTRKRLTTVTTKVLTGAAYRSVDSWTLGHQFPDPGDGTNKVLWLASIEHTGLAGSTAVALPKVTFLGTQMANRVDTLGDLGPAMNRLRVHGINTESGATISVNYSPQDCSTTSLPASPESNTRRCFPVYWDPEGSIGLTMEYFHKYVVTSVAADGRDGESRATETHYSYVGDGAWHYDDNELVPAKYRTWGQWRGYATVDVLTGAPSGDQPQLKTRYRYFRGMHGDRANPAGGTKTSAVDGITDHDQFNGFAREEITYDRSTVVATTRSTPWRSAATATAADGTTAHRTGISASETDTTAPALPGGKRTTRVTTTFDAYGMASQVEDLGDIATAADDQCTRITYARNTAANILGAVSRSETVGVNCATTPTRPGHVISDERYAYDGAAVGTAPTKGLVTRTEQVKAYTGATPSYLTTATTTYDALGRPTKVTDALGRASTTAYTPAGAGAVTKTVTTSPDPDGTGPLTAHVTTTELDPAWGATTKVTDPNGKVTQGTFDALGRLTAVWLPGRATSKSANTTYAYTVSTTDPNAVVTKTLMQDGTSYRTTTALYDGLLRARQTQVPSADRDTPGRVVTDTIYDSRGLVTRSNAPWFTAGDPATTTVVPTSAVPGRTLTEYDGAGRITAEILQVHEQERWRTTTTYGGDRVSVDPPTGGTPTTTVSDARGQTTALRQYTGPSPSGNHQDTTYTWDKAGRLAKVTDPAGNAWTYGYDLLGRQTSASDPDKGATSSTFDDAGQQLTSTDARGITLATVYDNLGRKTQLREGTATGALRASWTYDTLAKGQLTASTRHDGANAYTTAVTGYDDGYRPLGQSVTLPTAERELAGTYTTGYTYTANGQLKTTRLPAAGNLSAETQGIVYDSLSLPNRLSTGMVIVASTQYSPYGEVQAQDLGALYGTFLNYTYEHGTRRPATLKVSRENVANLDVDLAYTYDDAGNITSISDRPAGNSTDTQCFTYDGLRRLTEAWTPNSADCAASGRTVANLEGAAPYWTSYTHDLVGNRTSTTQHTTAADTTSTYAYPAAGSARPHAVTEVSTAGTDAAVSSYDYDAAGNTTTRHVAGESPQALTWDAEGKLDTITENAEVAGEYLYTADGDRLIRRENGTTTAYLPGGQELALTGSTVTAARYYTFNGTTVAVRTGSDTASTQTLINDHHGTAQLAVRNSDQQTTRRYQDPYGNPRGQEDPWVDDKGFLGKPTDTTGLTHVGARYYDPQIGRFITVDPIMDLKDPQQWQAYSYSNNNPTTWSDPTGLKPYIIDGGAAGGYVAPNGTTRASDKVKIARAAKFFRQNTADPIAGVKRESTYPQSRNGTPQWKTNADSVWEPPSYSPQTWVPSSVGPSEGSGGPSFGASLHRNLLTAQGIERWSGHGATATGFVALGGVALQGAGVALGGTCLASIGSTCPVTAPTGVALIVNGARITATFGWMSTGLSLVNAAANYRLGDNDAALRSLASAGVGAATNGAGTGATALANMAGRDLPYLNTVMIETTGWIIGTGVGS